VRKLLAAIPLIIAAGCASPAADNIPKVRHRVTTNGITGTVKDAAVRHGIPPAWYLAKVHVESRFNCRAVSPSGAIGIGQVMPATARSMGYSPRDMFDCYKGADAGARYASLAYRKSGGNLMYASTMYLTGINSGRRSSPYGTLVLNAMRNFQ